MFIIHYGTAINLADYVGLSVNKNTDITFTSESGSITASNSSITDAVLANTRGNDYAVHLELTIEFGEELFLFTSKNLGKPLTITAFGVQIGKPEKIKYSYTDRVQISGLSKKEADLLIQHLKQE